MTALDELKRRKIVQWALAYLAGAWVALQLVAILAGQFGWPAWIQRGATILLAFGFLIALVLAWYHGEKGRQRVSGPELVMVAALLVLAGAAIALVRGEPGLEGGEPGATSQTATTRDRGEGPDADPLVPVTGRSIAVLPLDNLSPSEEYAWFAGAMTEEITTALSKVPALRVTSRTSASRAASSGASVREMARALGVAHMLEGSVQRVEDEVRLTVQLIDARADEHLWSETYERELTDVLDAQVEIARQVADRLAASFTDREMERIRAGATDDPVAYDLWLRANEIEFDLATPEMIEESIRLQQRAAERDPGFWLAWVGLSAAYRAKAEYAGRPWADSSLAALDRAIDLAEGSSQAALRSVRAILFEAEPEEELVRVREQIREAVANSPSDFTLVYSLGHLWRAAGDLPAAARWMRRAAALDPLNFAPWLFLSDTYRKVGLHGPAERAVRRAIEADPQNPWPWIGLAFLHIQRGRYAVALTALDSLERRESVLARALRVSVHHRAGHLDSASSLSERLATSPIVEAPVGARVLPTIAHIRFLRGDSAGGRRMLELAESRGGPGLGLEPGASQRIALEIATVRGDAEAAVDALREYVDDGGRDVYGIQRSPLFSRVRQDSAFAAELAELRRSVEEMRRQIERDLQRDPWESR